MLERCPRCREPLLTLSWSALRRCEPCDGYVEPDGTWVERREGDIRYADVMTRGEPKTVAELAEALRSPPETFREDLWELCIRHRKTHQPWLASEVSWLEVEHLSRAPLAGYRDGVAPTPTRVRTTPLKTQMARWSYWALGYGPMGIVGGFALGHLSQLAWLLGVGSGMLSLVVGGNMAIRSRAWSGMQPRVGFEWTAGSDVITAQIGKQTLQLSREQSWVELEDNPASQRTTFRAWLISPGVRLRIAEDPQRRELRERVIRLEHALKLTAPPPS